MGQKILISPPGELLWPKLLEPGPLEKVKEGKVPKTGWSTDLLLPERRVVVDEDTGERQVLPDPDTQKFKDIITNFFFEKHGQGKRPGQNGKPWKPFLDEHGEPTGMLIFRFKTNQFFNERDPASGEIFRRPLPPPHVEDAQGRLWPKDLLIGNSSIGKVAYKMYAWANEEAGLGVSLDLAGARILVHVPYERPSAADAFGDPEPGFTVANSSPFGAEPMGEEVDKDIPF